MALVTRQGAGALLTQAQGDTNWDTLNGINEPITATTHTIDHTDELKTIEYSNASGITVTLTAIATIDANNDSQISDFKVTLKNIGAGTVTVNRSSTDTFEGGATSIIIPQYFCVTLQTDSTGGKWNTFGYAALTSFGRSYTSSDDKIDAFPAGTAMLFYQAAAPTGWTGSDALADHAIKIVTATSANGGSSAGTVGFSTVFATTATASHTLTIAEMPAHRHVPADGKRFRTGTNLGGTLDENGGSQGSDTQYTDYQGGGGGHTHDLDLRVTYAQMIIATKN